MTTISRRFLTVLAAASLCTATAFAAESKRGFDVPPGFEVVDLAQLADGESREFGTDRHAVTATRNGDNVVISMVDPESDRTEELICDLTDEVDRCLVMLRQEADGSRHQVVVLRHAKGGTHENVEIDEMSFGAGEGGHANMVFVSDDGSDPVVLHSDHPGALTWESKSGDGMHLVKIETGDPSKTMLRCPEGDTSMSIDAADAGVEFRCPKHGALLEKLEAPKHRMIRKEIRRVVHDEDDDEDEDK